MNRRNAEFLILGAGGQLGTEWVRYLRKHGLTFKAFTSKELDITDADEVKKKLQAQKPGVIINCAAYTKVDQAEDEPQKALEVNVKALNELSVASNQLDALLIHYSTDYVFPGRAKDKIKLPNGYPEDFQPDPINTYGKTKWEGEQVIRRLCPNHLILRVSWLCGASGNNFIKTMIRLCSERDEIAVVNDQWGSPTYTHNVVENTMALIKNDKSGTWHITSSGLITWYELTCEIVRMMGYQTKVHPVSSEEYPTKAVRPRFSKLDTTKLSGVAGSHIIGWKEGLKNLIDELTK